MTESRCYATKYWVEANSPEEAREKALIGDVLPVSLGETKCEVSDRKVNGPITRITVQTITRTKKNNEND